MLKKISAMLLALMLTASTALAADSLTDRKVATGKVDAAETIQLTAPYSGTLLPYTVSVGDEVRKDDPLMEMMTQALTAPATGKITGVFVAQGEDAAAASSLYGAAVAMEESYSQIIEASTQNAYNDEDNKLLHVGETLYFQSTKTDKTEGSGIVTMAQGKAYRVEIQDGHFDADEQLNLYRSSDYKEKERVGKGTVKNKAPLMLAASGIAAEVSVQAGDTVEKGQTMLRLTAADAELNASPAVSAPKNAVVIQLAAASGQQVWKGQLLMKLAETDQLEIVAEIDEADLSKLRVGDFLPVTLDMEPDHVLQGQITGISKVGVTKQNAAYFDVHLRVSGAALSYGASASVYVPKE